MLPFHIDSIHYMTRWFLGMMISFLVLLIEPLLDPTVYVMIAGTVGIIIQHFIEIGYHELDAD